NHRGTEKRTPRLSCVKALILEIRVRPRHPRLRKSAFLPRIRVHWRAFAVECLRSGSWILASKFSRFQFVSIRGWKRIIKLSDFQIFRLGRETARIPIHRDTLPPTEFVLIRGGKKRG